MSLAALTHYFLGEYLCRAMSWNRMNMRSWAVSGRNLMISFGRASGPGALPDEAFLYVMV
jgi:hypothetical protein